MPSAPGRGLIAWSVTIVLLATVAAHGQTPSVRKQVTAVRTTDPPIIDGRLLEECWSQAEPVSDFTQRDPEEGMPATERTEIRVLYDDEALYVAARLFDSEPGLIGRRLSSRDGGKDGERDADRATVYLDSMYDRLTGAAFAVTASNVQDDTIIFNDTFRDPSWDAVWESRVSVDEMGWLVGRDPHPAVAAPLPVGRSADALITITNH